MRSRATTWVAKWFVWPYDVLYLLGELEFAEADLAASKPDIDVMAEKVLAHEWRPGYNFSPETAHDKHQYDGACGVCRGDVRRILEVALGPTGRPPQSTGGLSAHELIALIAGRWCTNSVFRRCSEEPWRKPDAKYTADRWCDACIAQAALDLMNSGDQS